MNNSLELLKIPLVKLGVGPNIRKHNIEMELDDLAINIRANGQSQPILAYKKKDLDEYEVLEGQRRLNAFDILNTKYPDGGYDEIYAVLTTEPESANKKMSISLGANMTQLSMTIDDIQVAVIQLWKELSNMKLVAEEYGISEKTAKKYVRGARLNERLQESTLSGEICEDPTEAIDHVMEAVDLLNWTKDNDVSDAKIIKAAKSFAEKTESDKHDLISEWEKDPEREQEEVEETVATAPGTRKPKSYRISLDPDSDDSLSKYSKSRNKKPGAAASEIVIDQLKKLVPPSED